MRTRPHRSAFTLLELLLATSVLALMTVLLSALGSQLRAWSEDGERMQASMRLQRVVEVMRDQWAGRVADSSGVEGLLASPEYFTFVTSRPVLDLSFPVVRATYRWVPREDASGEPVFDLLYEETPVGRIGRARKQANESADQAEVGAQPEEQPSERESDRRERELIAQIDEPAQSWPLLRSFERGGWERFGRGAIVIRNDEAERKGIAPTLEYSFASDSQLMAERVPRWRVFDQELPGTPRAVRLVGAEAKEQFTCVFVIAASP